MRDHVADAPSKTLRRRLQQRARKLRHSDDLPVQGVEERRDGRMFHLGCIAAAGRRTNGVIAATTTKIAAAIANGARTVNLAATTPLIAAARGITPCATARYAMFTR